MINELVFHLGNRKTGSTSIQDALAQDLIHCAEKSIYYTATTNHLPLAKSLTPGHDTKDRDKRFHRLAARLRKSQADVAVISAEFFEDVDPRHLRETIDHYLPEFRDKIRLIAYVRPHAERVLSTFAEQTKLGQFYGPLERFHKHLAERGTLFYTGKFQAWRDVFGADFELRPFIRKRLLNNDIVHDFADYILKGSSFTLQTRIASNPSLSVEYLAMLREFQRVQKRNKTDLALRVVLGKYLGRQLAAHPVPEHHKLRLHKRVVESIIETYQDDARMLDATFFPEDSPMEASLLASRETAIEKAQSLVPTDNMSQWDIEMVQVWSELVHTMGKGLKDEVCKNLYIGPIQKPHRTTETASITTPQSPSSFQKATNL